MIWLSIQFEVPVLLKVKGKGVHVSIVIWLAAVPLLLLGCVQGESDPNPTGIPTMLPVVVAPTAVLNPAPSPTRSPTTNASPTTTSLPDPTPSLLEPEEILRKINTSMATARSFRMSGLWVTGETMRSGNSDTGFSAGEFKRETEPGRDSKLLLLKPVGRDSFPAEIAFEILKVDGIFLPKTRSPGFGRRKKTVFSWLLRRQ